MGYSLWGCKESDMTEHIHMQVSIEIFCLAQLWGISELSRGMYLYTLIQKAVLAEGWLSDSHLTLGPCSHQASWLL